MFQSRVRASEVWRTQLNHDAGKGVAIPHGFQCSRSDDWNKKNASGYASVRSPRFQSRIGGRALPISLKFMNTIDNQGETSGSSENRVRPSRMGKAHRPLRVWPAILLVVAMVCLRYGPGFVEGGLSKFWMLVVFGPLVCSAGILIWWLTGSRATSRERLLGAG